MLHTHEVTGSSPAVSTIRKVPKILDFSRVSGIFSFPKITLIDPSECQKTSIIINLCVAKMWQKIESN